MPRLTESMKNSGVLEIRDRLSSVSGGRVLDVGTQHGDFISTLIKSLKDYESFVGIDILEKDLEKAREAIDEVSVTFELMNAEELMFEDESFDTVCLSYSLHHLENVTRVLGEMVRVLKPGGHMIVQEMFSDEDQIDAQLTAKLIHHLEARLDRLEGIPHYETYSRKQLNDVIKKLRLSRLEVFESIWGLKCLYCDSLNTCENPKDERNIESGREVVEQVLERARTQGAEDIQHEAELLLERVVKTGYQSVSILFFICEK